MDADEDAESKGARSYLSKSKKLPREGKLDLSFFKFQSLCVFTYLSVCVCELEWRT